VVRPKKEAAVVTVYCREPPLPTFVQAVEEGGLFFVVAGWPLHALFAYVVDIV
jgi:hypothetical protein